MARYVRTKARRKGSAVTLQRSYAGSERLLAQEMLTARPTGTRIGVMASVSVHHGTIGVFNDSVCLTPFVHGMWLEIPLFHYCSGLEHSVQSKGEDGALGDFLGASPAQEAELRWNALLVGTAVSVGVCQEVKHNATSTLCRSAPPLISQRTIRAGRVLPKRSVCLTSCQA